MVRRIKCSQMNPQYGTISVNVRFIGKLFFLKFSKANPQMNQMITQLKSKGAEIVVGQHNWIMVNLFKSHSLVKLGGIEFDAKKTSPEQVEEILYDFYKGKYIEAKFTVEDIDE